MFAPFNSCQRVLIYDQLLAVAILVNGVLYLLKLCVRVQ